MNALNEDDAREDAAAITCSTGCANTCVSWVHGIQTGLQLTTDASGILRIADLNQELQRLSIW